MKNVARFLSIVFLMVAALAGCATKAALVSLVLTVAFFVELQ